MKNTSGGRCGAPDAEAACASRQIQGQPLFVFRVLHFATRISSSDGQEQGVVCDVCGVRLNEVEEASAAHLQHMLRHEEQVCIVTILHISI
jgi:hypothetical protein